MSPHPLIHTPRLQLRPLQPGDEDALFALFSHPQVMRHWSTPPWTDREAAAAMVALDGGAGPDASWRRLGLVAAAGGPVIGTCTLFDIDRGSRRAEIGYALAPSAWGRGLMHEALQALLHYGFDELNLNRVEADIDPANTASARALQRLGFQAEGLLRERWIVAGQVSDSALYGLLRRDWLARQDRPGVAGPTRPAAPVDGPAPVPAVDAP